jgi:putative flippase GtrA
MMQLARFLLVGGVNTGLGYLVIFSCMYLLGFSAELSNVIGYGFGLVFSYFLNRNFTFESTLKHGTAIKRFLIVFFISYGLNFLVLVILLHQMHLNGGLSQVIAGAVYVVASYGLNKSYVFGKSENT